VRRAAVAVALCLAAAAWIRFGPIDPVLLDLSGTTSTVVVDRRGVPLYEALSGSGTRSVLIGADELPPALVAATIAAEDRRFWSHYGVDPIAVARAVRQNVAERQIAEGGSTITQQVAKLLIQRGRSSLPAGAAAEAGQRGVADKIREAVLALRLEHRYTKREILAMYLNLAAYGNQIVGAERASRAYFGRDAGMLTPAQAAFLAGLPQRPSRFNPYRAREQAIARQRVVLRRMEAAGLLASSDAAVARDEQLSLARQAAPFLAPHFVEMALASSGERRPPRLETTIDAGLQQDIAGIIQSHRAMLKRHGAANVAVAVLDNVRGEWLAWEGSGDFLDDAHGGSIDGVRSPRQPGSALKPFTYALAFEQGATPATVLPDVPSHFPTGEQGVVYSPRNYDGRYRGPLLARRALAGSENVPAVALASELGVSGLLRFLTRAGFTTLEHNASYYGLGLTLGNAEVPLDELVAAYAAFARGGEWIQPAWRRGAVEDDAERQRRRLVSPVVAFWITDILSDPEAREFIFGRGGNLEFPFKVAVKTGTSQAYHDNWTIGYTRNVTVGVWVGNFDRKPLRDSTGVTGAGPIFHAVMLAATRRAAGAEHLPGDRPIVARPDGLQQQGVCALSGMAANGWCPSRQFEWLEPAEQVPCSWHHMGDEGLLTVWPPAYRQWAAAQGLLAQRSPLRSDLVQLADRTTPHERRGASVAPAHRSAKREGGLDIVNPPAGATYLIDPTLRREFQTLPLRATPARPGRIHWQVNGVAVGSSPSDGAVMWPLVPGTHTIAARDGAGNVAEARIFVR
jgi:penicillin-binding protein 1C